MSRYSFPNWKRDKQIVIRVLNGSTYRSVADENGLSANRVMQIMSRMIRKTAREVTHGLVRGSMFIDIKIARSRKEQIIKLMEEFEKRKQLA